MKVWDVDEVSDGRTPVLLDDLHILEGGRAGLAGFRITFYADADMVAVCEAGTVLGEDKPENDHGRAGIRLLPVNVSRRHRRSAGPEIRLEMEGTYSWRGFYNRKRDRRETQYKADADTHHSRAIGANLVLTECLPARQNALSDMQTKWYAVLETGFLALVMNRTLREKLSALGGLHALASLS